MEVRRRDVLGGAVGVCLAGNALSDAHVWAPPEGKDPGLKILSAEPLVMEAPDAMLAAARITPTPAVFVRQHHGAKAFNRTEAAPLGGWTVQVAGLVSGPPSFDAKLLRTLPRTEIEMVLQCSGNNRSEYSKIAPIKGVQWGRGGVANVRFAGPTVAAAFEALGLKIDPQAKYLTVGGADEPEKPGQADYEHSLPLELALESAILALDMNGAPLTGIHGGPVRLVTPGLYATMHVKWLDRLRFDAVESPTHYQMKDYRLPKKSVPPGATFSFTPANSEPHMHMNVNARCFSPTPESDVAAGAVRLGGVAWNDGRAALVSVEVTTDSGRTWQRAELEPAASPFAWRQWSATVALSPGPQTAWVRAIDALGRSQPLDGRGSWNPGGYGWNAVDRVSFRTV